MNFKRLIAGAIYLVFGISGVINLAHANSEDPQQALFLQAEQAIALRQWNKADSLFEQLQDYPLVTYLQRDRLLFDLALENNHQIEAFLDQYGDLPVARKLRYKWLHWLARNNHSSLFLRHYRDFGSTELACKQLEFRLRTSEDVQDIYARTKNIWLTGNSLPKACDHLFSQWQKAGQLDDDLIWQRLILATKEKQPKLVGYLNQKLSANSKEAGKLLAQVDHKPQSLAKVHFRTPLTDKAEDIIRYGLNKLAWQDADLAINIWSDLGKKYQLMGEFSQLKRAISLSLAIEKDPRANSWLSSLSDQNDDSVNQWLLSTALNDKNWSLIAQLSAQFSVADPETNKWRYWQAVAETQLGNLTLAQSLFSSAAQERSYYGFLAARQLNQQPELQNQPIDFNQSELDQLANSPAALRAKAFLDLGRLNDARREWNHLVNQTPLEEQAKLALLAHQWDWQHQAILAFARSKQINDVEKRFPLHQLQLFSEQAKQNQIPLSWAYAITRQESAFKSDAISSAGARGLMQLTHATAKDAAKSGIAYRQPSQLLAEETNIQLGTAHLGKIYQSFNAHPVLATAAYNAGKRKVQEWLDNSNTEDAIQWIEQIPYKETREYVKNVLTYQLIYAQLTNQKDDFIGQIHSYPILNNQTASTSR